MACSHLALALHGLGKASILLWHSVEQAEYNIMLVLVLLWHSLELSSPGLPVPRGPPSSVVMFSNGM